MIIGAKEFQDNIHTYVMGILNVTPDSFSDGGKYIHIEEALKQAELMLEQGADIIDVGGESTRPGHVRISDEEEISRVVPVIEALRKEFNPVISLDTYKSQVALAGIEAGADMINDIWGLKADIDLANIISKKKVSVCIMHNRDNMNYVNLIDDVCADLQESINIALNAGIDHNRICIDPGVGFAKTTDDNLEVIAKLDRFKTLGYPVLLGTSRKSVIGNTLDLPVGERLEGTLATTVYAVNSRCEFVRVHDVQSNVRIIKMSEAILNKR